jgi:NAD(P)-dependent dehydrogenase (short-subunit alcohol dehydrogenase family)
MTELAASALSADGFRLDGKTAVVTGGGTGIGREIALALTAHGAELFLVGRRPEPLEETAREIVGAGGRAHAVPGDATDQADAARCLDQVLERSGHVDVLFNNAGRSVRVPATEITLEQWDELLAVNTRGPFIWSQIIGRAMLERGSGSIINTTSTMGHRPWTDRLLNAVTRAATEQMTRALAIEWAPRGVRVNALAPGFVSTPAMEAVLSDAELMREVERRTPQRRVLAADEMRGAAVFLASDASSGVTGQVIRVDGGWTAW